MVKISTSILSSENRLNTIKKLNETKNNYLHIDAMDGKFVDNYQMPIEEILELEKYSTTPLDIHLMVENPEEYIEKLENKNIKYITIHYEIEKNINTIINKIKSLGYLVGLSIKPKTEPEEIFPYLNYVDMILIMSVEPGYGGQKFMPSAIEKAKLIKEKNRKIKIEMDGGINDTNIAEIKNVVDIAVVGSYITNSDDYNEAINKLKN